MQVTIEPYNSIFIKVDFQDNSDARIFLESVSEIIPNFGLLKRNPKNYHRFKNWDGKIRYFNAKDGLLYKGLHTPLIQFCNAHNIEVIDLLNDDIQEAPTNYLDTLNVNIFDNKTRSYIRIIPDQNQRTAFHETIKRKNLRVQMATGSGKSLYSYCVLHYLRNKVDGKIVVVVPRQDLGNQLYNEYLAYSKFDNGFDMDDVSVIHSKSKDCPKNKILFITYQTLVNFDDDFFKTVDVLIIDEAHKSTNKSLRGINEKCVNTVYKIGMSGTFEEKNPLVSDMCLQAILGDIFEVVSQRGLIDSGRASEFEGRVYVLKHREDDVKLYRKLVSEKNKIYELEYASLKIKRDKRLAELEQTIEKIKVGLIRGDLEKVTSQRDFLKNTHIETVSKKWGYIDEVDYLNQCEARNHFILNMAMENMVGNSLVLFSRIETHGDILHEMALKKNEKYNTNLIYIHGTTKLKPDVAKALIETSEKRSIILANIAMVREGWSVNNLHFCYLATTIKNSKALTQVVGRLLRKDGSNIKTALYIIIDDLRYNGVNNYSYEHGLENIKTLMAENHEVKKMTINLDEYFKRGKL